MIRLEMMTGTELISEWQSDRQLPATLPSLSPSHVPITHCCPRVERHLRKCLMCGVRRLHNKVTRSEIIILDHESSELCFWGKLGSWYSWWKHNKTKSTAMLATANFMTIHFPLDHCIAIPRATPLVWLIIWIINCVAVITKVIRNCNCNPY